MKEARTIDTLETKAGGVGYWPLRDVLDADRLDTRSDLRYFREGGILPAVVRELAGA